MKDAPGSFLRLMTLQSGKSVGTPVPPQAPPSTHAPQPLPVLTEVIPIQETVPGALMVFPDETPAVDVASPSQGLQPVPEWLLRKDAPPTVPSVRPGQGFDMVEDPSSPDFGLPSLPGFHGRLQDPPAQPASSGFGTSWWMTDSEQAESPRAGAAVSSRGAPSGPAELPPLASEPAPRFVLNEAALVKSVMIDLDRQVSLMFEHRMREAMAPAFSRALDALMNELRVELALQMREMVTRSVAMAVARQAQGLDEDEDDAG